MCGFTRKGKDEQIRKTTKDEQNKKMDVSMPTKVSITCFKKKSIPCNTIPFRGLKY